MHPTEAAGLFCCPAARYLGAGTGGADFLTASSLVTGLTAANGNRRSGIVQWNNPRRR